VSTVAEELLEPIVGDLQEFERRLVDSIAADLGPMASAMEHIVKAGGKRLRPALVILSGRLGDAEPNAIFNIAMGIEFIHTATLVHDDLIDNSPTRRGIRTIHEALGPNPAIIIGDYYFAKGANLLSSIGSPAIDSAISHAVMTICMGELLQMTSRNDYDQTVESYYRKIERKTATLVSTCCYAGGVVSRQADDRIAALRRYGYNLGMAFQIVDDVLDYVATSDEMGKPVGADLRQGTVTLPLMLALHDPAAGPKLRRILERHELSDSDYDDVVVLVRESPAIEAAERHAHTFAAQARAELSPSADSAARTTLERICDYVVERRF
jgi:heptaprenyl diphosphate synthase